MRTAIVYMSQHGCAEKAAIEVKKKLVDTANADLFNLRKTKFKDPDSYQTIIIGGSIHAGKIQKRLAKFMEQYHDVLLTKQLGLYLCCMEQGEKAQRQFDAAFPLALRKRARAKRIFGGEFNFAKMNFFERLIVRKVTGSTQSVDKINYNAIEGFALAFD